MYDSYDNWLEDVENTVFVYFNQDLDFFIETYGLSLDEMFDSELSPMDVVDRIQALIEGDDDYLIDTDNDEYDYTDRY